MKNFDPATEAHLLSGKNFAPIKYVWVEAKNRATGALETMGLSTFDDHTTETVISGRTQLPVTRPYFGIGGNLIVPPIPLTTDLTIRRVQIGLSQISPQAEQLIRGYDAHLAPVEIHIGFLDPDTMLLIAPPRPIFVGWINKSPIVTPSANGEGRISVECVSHARKLTFTNPAKRSDEQQKRRQGDRFRRYNDVAGGWVADISWGEEGGQNTGSSTGFAAPSGGASGERAWR